MTSLTLREAGPDDAAAAHALGLGHPWPEYGFYRLFGFDFGPAYLASEAERFVRSLGGGDGLGIVALRGERVLGLAGLSRLGWESGHFGLEMGAVPFLLGPASLAERAEVADALLAGVEDAARGRGLQHLSLRVDASDLAALSAAQRRGFRVVDTLVTFVHDSNETPRAALPAIDETFERVTLRKEELAAAPRGELAALEAFMREGYRIDRFHSDLRLPAERSDALYVAWFRKVFDGSWADGAQALRRDGRYVGFCSFQHAAQVASEFAGPSIIGRGLAAVLPEARGGYAVLTRMIHTRCPFGSRFQEFDTQLQNFPTIRVWIQEGMRFVRARITLHRWLDERVPGGG